MQAKNKNQISAKQVSVFLSWTFGISWLAWTASALLMGRLPLLPQLPQLLFIVGGFGPAIGAKLVLGKSLKEMLVFIKAGKKAAGSTCCSIQGFTQ